VAVATERAEVAAIEARAAVPERRPMVDEDGFPATASLLAPLAVGVGAELVGLDSLPVGVVAAVGGRPSGLDIALVVDHGAGLASDHARRDEVRTARGDAGTTHALNLLVAPASCQPTTHELCALLQRSGDEALGRLARGAAVEPAIDQPIKGADLARRERDLQEDVRVCLLLPLVSRPKRPTDERPLLAGGHGHAIAIVREIARPESLGERE
jgi:hypothetical protein